MDKILINPTDIESCWKKPDACMVKTKTGKVWVCEKEAMDIVMSHQKDNLVSLPLKRGGKYGK